MKTEKLLNCPECGANIDIDKVLYSQLQEKVKEEFSGKIIEQKKKYDAKVAELDFERNKLDKAKENLQERISKEINNKLKIEKQKFEKEIRVQIQDEQAEQLRNLENELKEKSNKLKELSKAKAMIHRLEREKDEIKDEIEAEAEQRITEQIKKERGRIKKVEEERVELKLVEKDSLIEQLKNNLKEAQRKAEQGSMQAQGEAQEVAIEEYLKESFPIDTIEEVKKGARGADCMQIIHTRTRQNCGSIYYESKRTKNFSPSWIEKFKNDMRDKGVSIGVLVTDVMPSDMVRMGQKDGVWICTFNEFKGLCFVLRESIIQISNAISTQENKGEKMTMLYDFLTSNEFRLQIEAIVEGFTQMKDDLEKEKRSIQGHWKKREKQIEKVILNTNFMYNSIKGIAGNAILPINSLELPETDDLDSENIDEDMDVLEGIRL